jgi:hypothetical protein
MTVAMLRGEICNIAVSEAAEVSDVVVEIDRTADALKPHSKVR